MDGHVIRIAVVLFTWSVMAVVPHFSRIANAENDLPRGDLFGDSIEYLDGPPRIPADAISIRSISMSVKNAAESSVSHVLVRQPNEDTEENSFGGSSVLTSAFAWVCYEESQSGVRLLFGAANAGGPGYVLYRVHRSYFKPWHEGGAVEPEDFLNQPFDWGTPGKLPVVTDPSRQLLETSGSPVVVSEKLGNFTSQWRRYTDAHHVVAPENWNRKARMALVPQGDLRVLLYAVCEPCAKSEPLWPARPDRHLAVFVYEFGFVPRTPEEVRSYGTDKQWAGLWTRKVLTHSLFVAPFEVVRGDRGDFLVTGEDDLFFVDNAKLDRDDAMRRIKLRDGELVQALIYDHDRGNTAFAFTSKYWFEVKEPIEYREFELGPLKADDPLPTLVRAAREVRKFYPALPKAEPPK